MVFGFKLWSRTLKKRKMNDNPSVKKLIQITEEAQKPVHSKSIKKIGKL